MKTIEIKVCMCTQCVINGAMDIVESIESLQKLKSQLRFNAAIKVNATELLCDKHEHGVRSPLVSVDGEIIEKANTETVTAKIISIVSRKADKKS